MIKIPEETEISSSGYKGHIARDGKDVEVEVKFLELAYNYTCVAATTCLLRLEWRRGG